MIDRKTLLERCDGDQALVRELLEDFLSRQESEMAGLNSEDDELHRHAHRLKGLALNLSMTELRDRASSVERSAGEGSVDKAELDALRVSLQETCESARKIIAEEADE